MTNIDMLKRCKILAHLHISSQLARELAICEATADIDDAVLCALADISTSVFARGSDRERRLHRDLDRICFSHDAPDLINLTWSLFDHVIERTQKGND